VYLRAIQIFRDDGVTVTLFLLFLPLEVMGWRDGRRGEHDDVRLDECFGVNLCQVNHPSFLAVVKFKLWNLN
jgi:hypothetical protein